MLRFILNKIALIIPTLIGITICAFGFVRLLPGDPILALAGEHGVSAERYEVLNTSSVSISPSGSNISTTSAASCTAISAPRSATHHPVMQRVP